MSDDQAQFLTVVSPEEAHRRWWTAVAPAPRPPEPCLLADLLGRRLAVAIAAPLDVPGFDRANVDGFAVLAADTYGASERRPLRLRRLPHTIHCGVAPDQELLPGHAAPIATGGALPRGADAVVMVEHTDPDPDDPQHYILIQRPTTPGAMISFAGADITRGEVMLRPGDRLGPREIGVLAALGLTQALVHPRPRVAILSTGDELIPPGAARPHAKIHDCNQELLAATCRELGAEVHTHGIIPDDLDRLRDAIARALQRTDLLLLSGGTSKGAGDLTVRALTELPGPTPTQPPILVHGVALKPGKPLCLAATPRPPSALIPIAVLPGFPTSALFTFHEFVAPLLHALAGAPPQAHQHLQAALPHTIRSERGRREYHLIQLLAPLDPQQPPIALPIGKGSGSVTAFARADGFFALAPHQERLDESELVEITRIGPALTPPDLLILGSHCTGLERLADRLHARGLRVRLIAQGSQAGLLAAERALCDIAPIHLCDPVTGRYNTPFVPDNCLLVPGYQRIQGILARPHDPRLAALGPPAQRPFDARATFALADQAHQRLSLLCRPDLIMVNRNRGSGTRVLLDRLLDADPAAPRPRGYHHEARSHQGVAACIRQGRADWGLAVVNVAEGLDFWPIAEESFDLLIPRARLRRPPVAAFLEALQDPQLRAQLRADGFRLPSA